jgi:hypothetical protein
VEYIGVRREMHTNFWWRNRKGNNNSEKLGVDGRIILKLILYITGRCGMD